MGPGISPAPHISRLVARATGTVLVSNPSDTALFALFLARDGGQDYVDSSLARETSMEVTRTATGSRILLGYSAFPNLDVSVRVWGTFDDHEPLSQWRIEVQNKSGRRIERVRFPLLRALPAIGDAGDDFLVFPMYPGVLIREPWKNWPMNFGPWPRYPGPLSAQFVAYQDASSGIYLASRDPGAGEKLLSIWKKEDGFGLCHDYFPSEDAGVLWECPYPVSIGVTGGSWYDTADIYKTWAAEQPWCARTLAQRNDVPGWLRKGPLVYVCSMRTYDRKGNLTGSYYPRLLESLRYLKSQTDGQILAMLSDWENNGRWTGGDYFPVFDEKIAEKTIAQIKAEGFRPFLYLSGLYYTFENQGIASWKKPVPGAYLPHFVVDGKTGEPQVFSTEEQFFSSPWKRNSYAFCVGSSLIGPLFRDVMDKTSKLGVSVLQMDQTTSGAGYPCSSLRHDHAAGAGRYQIEGFQALLQEIRSYGKAKNPDFALFHEEPHEQLIPYTDGFHMREYTEGYWYRDGAGAVGIPLFTYLYHEYAIGYGGDSANIGPRGVNTAWNVRCHAVNLVTGKTPGAATWMSPDQLFNSDPRAVKMIRNHRRLLAAGASRHLMEGRMLHPFTLEAPTLNYALTRWEGGKSEQFTFAESAVLTSSWQAPDGSVGHLFVNLSPDGQPLEVDVDTRNIQGGGPYDVSMYRSGAGDRFQPLWKAEALPKRLNTTLAPDEVLFLELRSSKRTP